MLSALGVAQQQLQQLRAGLTGAAAYSGSGQQLAAISEAWGAFMGAYASKQVSTGPNWAWTWGDAPHPRLSRGPPHPLVRPLQVSLADLQGVAASLQTAAPLLGLPVISAAAAGTAQARYSLASLSGVDLFR